MEEKQYCYEYPHPAVTADNVIFGFDNKELNVLLIKRKNAPYEGRWAFPGGFMAIDETIEECAKRELEEETGFKAQRIEQLMCFSDVWRDPRERVITIAFFALVRMQEVKGGDDALEAEWFKLKDVPALAFDHDYILRIALNRLRERVYFEPICFELLGEQFTMSELQRLYEEILQVKFDRRNFFRKIQSWGILKRVDKRDENEFQNQVTEVYNQKTEDEDFSLDFSETSPKLIRMKKIRKILNSKKEQQDLGNIFDASIKYSKADPILSQENANLDKETSDLTNPDSSLGKYNPRATIYYTFDKERYIEKKNEGFRLQF
ncbi:MAG: NUDIX hydrolase [Bacteroidales bacterium]|nr:NUDIX hydrolase [Bacteroidales bacterium]